MIIMANESKLYIGRYCSACGKRHEKGAASCPFCGVQANWIVNSPVAVTADMP